VSGAGGAHWQAEPRELVSLTQVSSHAVEQQ
jgi:hypothetical protein